MKLRKATDLKQGDVLLLPMNKTATIQDEPKVGRTFVNFRTEFGPTRVERESEQMVES